MDVSAVLAANAGQTIQIRFNAYVPEVWSGPNGLGIDAISLTTATSFAAVPEPGGLLLLGGALLGLSAVHRLLRP